MARSKPLLIKLGMVGSLLGAAFLAAFPVFLLFGPEMGPYTINNQLVDRETFQRFFVANFLLFAVVHSLVLAGVAYGFWKERSWTRHVAVSSWVLSGAFLIVQWGASNLGDLLFSLTLSTLIPLGIAIWYFYFKPNVVAYFQELVTQD